MSTLKKLKQGAGVAGAIVLVTAGVAVAQATGGTSGADQAPETTRAAAVLAATQGELADTELRVTEIELQHVIDGREIYALSGGNAECILVAGEDQDAGRSQSIACAPTATAAPSSPLATGFELGSGSGFVDLVWVDGQTPSQVATSGAPTEVRIAPGVVAAVRANDSRAAELRWNAPTAGPVEVELASRADREALAE